MEQFNIEWKDIASVKPYSRNAKKHDDKQVANVAESIKQFGWQQPIVCDADGVIIIGHCRLLAAKKLGLKKVPVKTVDNLSEEQVKKLRTLDNKLNESDWDFDLLAEDIADLDFSGFDIDWGLPADVEETEIVEDEAPEVDEEIEPITQLGDIWQLGKHRLMCGDSTDKNAIEKLLEDKFGEVDLVLTDPPYNVGYKGKTKDELQIENDNMSKDDFEKFLSESFEIINEMLKRGGVFYVWHASSSQREFENALNNTNLYVREQLIWAKNAFVLGRQDYQWQHEPCFYGWKEGTHNWYGDRKTSTVLNFDRPNVNREHPTMKPIALIALQIKNSTKKDDIVFDGFGGSGSTLIACEQLNRICYMMELDPKYCDVIIKRYENLTGQKAVKINV